MQEINIGRVLELHEILIIEKGYFERAWNELKKLGTGHIKIDSRSYRRLCDSVSEIETIASAAGLTSTEQAAMRTRQFLSQVGDFKHPNQVLVMQSEGCGNVFRHLMDICSRIRDDCHVRLFFQIAPERAKLLRADAPHFGSDIERAFGLAAEDISEAASCLALERSTACVFHLMRALEVTTGVVATRIGATVRDQHGKGLPWGVIAENMKTIIDKMPKGSDEQIKWYRVQSLLEVVNRAWRVPTAHPKQTYTPEEARRVFDAARAFLDELAPLV